MFGSPVPNHILRMIKVKRIVGIIVVVLILTSECTADTIRDSLSDRSESVLRQKENGWEANPVPLGASVVDLITSNQTVNENDTVTLQCRVSPTDAVIGKRYWKRNKKVIITLENEPEDARYILSEPYTGANDLTIKNVNRLDEGLYLCGVVDESRGNPVVEEKASKLTVYYMDNPKAELLFKQRANVGNDFLLKCEIESSFPREVNYTWMFNGNAIDLKISKRHKVYGDDSVSWLEIGSSGRTDIGNYYCLGKNGFLSRKSNTVRVDFPEGVTVSKDPWIVISVLSFVIIALLFGFALISKILQKKKESKFIENAFRRCVNDQTDQDTGDATNDATRFGYRISSKKPLAHLLSESFLYSVEEVGGFTGIGNSITCTKGMLSSIDLSINWETDPEFFLEKKNLLSFVPLPGLYDPYIFIGLVNVSEIEKQVKQRLVVYFPNEKHKPIDYVLEKLRGNGEIEELEFNCNSGRKLSSGRLAVVGWLKRKHAPKRSGNRRWRCRPRFLSIESQPQEGFSECVAFILWSDDEEIWNVEEVYKKEVTSNKYAFKVQLTETKDHVVHVIVSNAFSNIIHYQGDSDNCERFNEVKNESINTTPAVSVCFSGGSLVSVTEIKERTVDEEMLRNRRKSKPSMLLLVLQKIYLKICPRRRNQNTAKPKSKDLYHFQQDTNNKCNISLRTYHHKGESFQDIIKDKKEVCLEQIIPFICNNKSKFLLIYTKEEDNYISSKYKVLTLDQNMKLQ